jgi:hypothetical protein
MRNLEDMHVGHRVMLAAIIVVIVLILVACVGYLSGRWEVAAQQLQPPVLSKYEQQFIELDRQAITDAYKQQLVHLFLVWAKDESQQPTRAVTGAKQARSMYERAMAAIDERKQRLEK